MNASALFPGFAQVEVQVEDFATLDLDCGHFLAEERPEETVAELSAFLGER